MTATISERVNEKSSEFGTLLEVKMTTLAIFAIICGVLDLTLERFFRWVSNRFEAGKWPQGIEPLVGLPYLTGYLHILTPAVAILLGVAILINEIRWPATSNGLSQGLCTADLVS